MSCQLMQTVAVIRVTSENAHFQTERLNKIMWRVIIPQYVLVTAKWPNGTRRHKKKIAKPNEVKIKTY